MQHNPFATTKKDFTDSLQHTGFSLGEASATSKAASLGLPYINLHTFALDLAALTLWTKEDVELSESVSFFLQDQELFIGTVNPKNSLLQEKLTKLKEKFTIRLHIISASSLAYALAAYAKVVHPTQEGDTVVRVKTSVDVKTVLQVLNDANQNSKMPVGDFLEQVFAVAAVLDASDIHFEPAENRLSLRFRVDGVLQTLVEVGKNLQNSLITRIKLISHLKFNVENKPQDGRFTFYRGNDPVDVRVSILPSAYGEGIVLRLLGVGAIKLKLEDLGLTGRSYKIIEQELQKPNGCILTTGPTGSGKTTTLYAFLNELNSPGVKIITIEDPVEYRLEGVQQTPIDHTVDFNFAVALRAILRQDPEIIMVGEIRDAETAETALQASLTGHVVLSTLHTNDSFGAVPRLISMGVKPFIIAPGLNAVIAQRLVRRLCEKCKQEISLDSGLKSKVERVLGGISKSAKVSLPSPQKFFHSPGCEACHNLGYKGRIGIYEVIHINDAQKALILKNASMLELKQQALSDGTLTMAQDGILKVLQGITDVEEVFRVAGE